MTKLHKRIAPYIVRASLLSALGALSLSALPVVALAEPAADNPPVAAAANATDIDADKNGVISPEEAAAQQSDFTPNKAYKVTVELRDNKGKRSMAGDTLLPDAELLIDANGVGHIQLHFQRTPVLYTDAHATAFKLFPTGQDGSTGDKGVGGDLIDLTFTLDENLDASATLMLPKKLESGYYWGWINSNVMDHTVFLYIDWESLTDAGTPLTALDSFINSLPQDNAKDEYTSESWNTYTSARNAAKALVDAISTDATAAVQKYDELVHASKALTFNNQSPFKSAGTWYADVSDTDVVGKYAINKQATFFVAEDGSVTATVKFNSYEDWAGLYIVREAQLLDRSGKPISDQSLEILDDNSAVWTFKLPYNSASGVYKALVTADSADAKKPHNIQFDWKTLRDNADFTELNELIKTAEAKPYSQTDNYMTQSYEGFAAALKKAQDLAANPKSTQPEIDSAIRELKAAMKNLRTNANKGTGNTVNSGFSGVNQPKSTEKTSLQWEGSRVLFGHDSEGNPLVWRVLDKDKGLLILDGYQEGQPFYYGKDTNTTNIHYWDTSSIRTYLNDEWIKKSFSDAEAALLSVQDVKSMDYAGKVEVAPTTQDKVWILDYNAYSTKEWGFGSDATRATGLYHLLTRTVAQDGYYPRIRVIEPDGSYNDMDGLYQMDNNAVAFQPVIALDMTKVAFTRAANRNDGFARVEKTDDNVWELSVKAELGAPQVKALYKDGSTFTLISDLRENEKLILAVARDGSLEDGTLTAFGSLVASDVAGEYSFTLPDGFDSASDKLYLMRAVDGSSGELVGEPVELDITAATQRETPGNNSGQDQEKPDNQSGNQTGNQSGNQAGSSQKSDGKKLPKTGDAASTSGLFAGLSAAAMSISALLRRKKNN